jgi:hypothetical protein
VQDALSPSLRVTTVLTIPTWLKTPSSKSPQKLKANSAVSPCKIKRSLSTAKIQRHKVSISIPKGRNRRKIRKEGWNQSNSKTQQGKP